MRWLLKTCPVADLTFIGAAGTVTGSKHLVSTNGKSFFIDCGLFQGPHEIEALNHVPLPIAPSQLDAIVITHGHLDHVGYLPKIVRDGYRGPIYCTPPTADVIEIVLEDAAHLQHHMHERGFLRERSYGLAPFFTGTDVQATLRQLKAVALESDFDVCGGTMRHHYAGHIIGAAFVEMKCEGKRAIFSGDVGRYGRAKIVHLSGFSAHADQTELLRWLEPLRAKGVRAYIVHAEPGSATALAALLNERGFTATAAERGTTVAL